MPPVKLNNARNQRKRKRALSDTSGPGSHPSVQRRLEGLFHDRAFKEMMKESKDRVFAWLSELPLNPRRLLRPKPQWDMKHEEAISEEDISPNAQGPPPGNHRFPPDEGTKYGLGRYGIHLIEDGEDTLGSNLVPSEIAELKDAVHSAQINPQFSSCRLNRNYEEARTLEDVLHTVLLPFDEIQDARSLVFVKYNNLWEHHQVLLGSLPTRASHLLSPANYDNLIPDPKIPGYVLGFSSDIFNPDVRVQSALDFLRQDFYMSLIPDFPFFAVEIKPDENPSPRTQNARNAASMLLGLYLLVRAVKGTNKERDIQNDFYTTVRSVTMSVTAEEAEVCCYRAAPNSKGRIICYGQVIGTWKLGQESGQYAVLRRVVRDILEKIRHDNLTFIEKGLKHLAKRMS